MVALPVFLHSAFFILPFPDDWLWVALPAQALGVLPSRPADYSAFRTPNCSEGGFARPFCILHSAFCLLPSLPGAHHKHPEYNSHPSPPSWWSGGTLDKLWTCSSTIELPQAPVFDQPHLSSALHPPPCSLLCAPADGVLPANLRRGPLVH